MRRIAHERAQAEIERIREEEEAKRKVLAKKHAVSHSILVNSALTAPNE